MSELLPPHQRQFAIVVIFLPFIRNYLLLSSSFMKFSLPTLCASGIMFGLLSLAACKSDNEAKTDANQIAFNDFESLAGWASGTESLTKEQAHSGKYSVMVGPNNEFGLGYMMQLNKVFSHKPHKVRISCWGYMTDAKANAQLDLQLFDLAQNKAVFGEVFNYQDVVKEPGKWVQITKDVTLPATATGTQQLRVFLWRAGATSPAFIDDLSVSEVPE